MPTIDFGIDLGTTESSIVCCRNGQVRVFQSTEMMNVTPSVIHISKTGRMVVGKKAYDAWPADPQNTQAEFKRWMGFADKLNFPASGKLMSAEDLSAEILKALRADVRRATSEDVTAAVITVPAAFGALQCDATGRAAKLAGFLEAPLLQEPIAAAIAYGASAEGKGQRWLIFDLGGGTLDIAVVSTRNGRLSVLEHQGNNRLGGKDIDRLIAKKLLFEPLSTQLKLPDRVGQPGDYDLLIRNLVRFAEQAKIALSTCDSAPVDLYNIGDDLTGAPIEASLTLTRSEVERESEPVLAQCLELVHRALVGARLGPADIDRVLLVGGPTQMPVVRQALTAVLGNKLDYSIDPITVVARGAALYASTLERATPSPSTGAVATSTPVQGAVQLKLNHERAAGTLQSPVAGIFAQPNAIGQIKIDAEGGVWSSGWLPAGQNRFVTEVMLTAGKPMTQFTITARTTAGSPVAVAPSQFSIAHMLPMSAPPTPHTIAIELSSLNGIVTFDPVFKRHAPLPAEDRKSYRADRTLRQSDHDESLPIKFWEIEVSDDPQEKWWAGCVHIRAEHLRRPLLEGSEIQLTVKIDKSRKMSVEVFIPSINQGFSDEVFVPDPPTTRDQLQQQLDLLFERAARVYRTIYAAGRDDLRDQADAVQLKLEVIAEQLAEEQARGNTDPDALLGTTATLRKVQLRLTQIEKQLESQRHLSPLVVKLKSNLPWITQVVQQYGSSMDKETLVRLTGQMERYIETDDQRGLKFVADETYKLAGGMLHGQAWYWQDWLQTMKQGRRRFVNQLQADKWIKSADAAAARNDLSGLRSAVMELEKLWPPDQLEAAKEQAMQSGLKRG
ncbi:MAG TPA: Hsp70 family protein [Tepidisphaeraceae bacterium]|jgi:molecular chaperone DnaK|nr:Hsp70 family protein [Tepidisphaeraceae bacterium]